MQDYYRQYHKYVFLVCDEDLYLYKTSKPYNEGYIKKVAPTNIISSIRHPKAKPPLDSIFKTLPPEIVSNILFKTILFEFKCRNFKNTFKLLKLIPELFTKFYLHFYPKETNQIYTLYFEEGFQSIYKDRVSRILYLCTKLHDQLIKPSFESPPYYIIEIYLKDTPIFVPILPWTIITGNRPKNYELEINMMTNEYPNDNENHFAFITGPTTGDIAWLRGTFYSDNILLASTFQRPVIPIIFTSTQSPSLYQGSNILSSEPTWIHFTHMLQYIYGQDTRLFLGNQNSQFDFTFHDSLDPKFMN
jgi:hypothetical protein